MLMSKNGTKNFINKQGYRVKSETFVPVHRKIAYNKIYIKDRKKYPLPFSSYEVHHKNRDRQDNRPCNLELLTIEEHQNRHKKDFLKQ